MKKMKKYLAAVLTAAAMLFTACGDAGISDIINAIAAAGGKPPASDELKLKTLTVYYSEDEDKTNLVSFSPSTGDYTITDVVNNKGTLTIEAEAQKTAAQTSVSWSRGAMSGKAGPVENEPATLTDIPAPGVEDGQNLPVVITVTVRNNGQSYPYTITAKAPGVDSSLDQLSFRYEADITPLSDWDWDKAGFWDNELLYDKNLSDEKYTAFDGSSQYVLELTDKTKSGSNVAITALAIDGNSVIELTVNGAPVEPEETPEIPAAAAVFRDEAGDPNGGDGGLGGGGEELPPAEPVEAVNHRWLVQIPEAGEEALTIALRVTNATVFSAYTITLVPPPDDAADSTDTRLLNIQFKDEKGRFIIPQSSEAGGFNSGTSVYQFPVSGFTGPFTIESCAPSHASADVVITYTADGGEPHSIPYNNYADAKIPMPAKEGSVVVKFRVKIGSGNEAELNAHEYSVTFTNPRGLSLWKGTATLSGSGASLYTITGLNAITSDNAAHTAVMDGDKWSAEISETQADANNPPVAFTATLTKNNGDGNARYCVVESVSDMIPNSPYTLTFTVDGGGTGSADNPLYTMVYKADDLKKMGKNTGYYIANDIDLTTLGDWAGPPNYAGHFNGGGKTIKLELSRTSGDTGLFQTLDNGAIIENLNVEVSTKNNTALTMTSDSHFGGVVGAINAGTFKIKGVTVAGTLKYAGDLKGTYLLVGALIGEIREGQTVNLTIENCEADVQITGNFTGSNTGTGAAMIGFGGLIGKNGTGGGGVTIKNSSTRGIINVTTTAHRCFAAGGLIGFEGQGWQYNTSSIYCPLVIENCYSAMEIVIETKGSVTTHTSAGGLIGSLYNSSASSKIINSAALNPKVLAIASSSYAHSGRVIGRLGNFNANAQLSTYARADMLTGTTEPGAVISGAGAANSENGLSKTAADFMNQATWTALKFSTDNWDFSNIAKNGYPTLKFK